MGPMQKEEIEKNLVLKMSGTILKPRESLMSELSWLEHRLIQ